MTPLRQAFIRELVIRGTSPRTQEAYVAGVFHLARHYRRSPAQIRDEELKAYLFYLAQERQLAASTINQAVCALRAFYTWVLKRSPQVLDTALPHTRREHHLPHVYSPQEIQRLLTVGCVTRRDRAFLMTVYGAGLRLREATHLKIQHLDAARHQIRIEQGKGKKDRFTLLSPRLLEELRTYWRHDRPEHWLFPSVRDPDQPLADGTAQRIFYRAVARAGLPDRHGLHSLRHSFATGLVEAGVELPAIQRLLGHTSLATTAIYLHVRVERLHQVQSPLQLLDLDSLATLGH